MSDAVFFIRQGASLAQGTVIDEYLHKENVETLYRKWNNDWGYPLEYPGGITAITCEMVMDAPEKEFLKVFGKKRGAVIRQIAKENAG